MTDEDTAERDELDGWIDDISRNFKLDNGDGGDDSDGSFSMTGDAINPFADYEDADDD